MEFDFKDFDLEHRWLSWSWFCFFPHAEYTKNISEAINNEATAADSTDFEELDKETGANAKASTLRLKAEKMDISKGFSSDYIIHSPDEFFEHIVLAFWSLF